MKKVAFIVSHLGSGSAELLDILNRNPRVLIQNQNAEYAHPTDLEWLYNSGHKMDSAAAVYGDHLVTNVSFYCRPLYKECFFIYVVRSARPSLHEIISQYGHKPKNALLYYTFRLRRICEMARQTPGAVLLTWEDVANGKGLPLVEEYLGLKEPLKINELKENEQNFIDLSIISDAQESYERHLYYLKQLDLRRLGEKSYFE